ncbi:MAG TPA: acylphosphatase [Ktedonobacterales bacterium]|nr:acylphosphatase [Ktedonobacterales bacterium]
MQDTPDADQIVRLNARVRGRVQGVGYRFFAQRHASAQGVRGYVRNLPDGSVEVVAEGPRPALERFLDALQVGPHGTGVSDVVVAWEAAQGMFVGFQIRY